MSSDPTVALTAEEAARIDKTDPVRRDHALGTRLQQLEAATLDARVTVLEAVETTFDSGTIPAAQLDLSTNPTAGDAITIGADIYEFQASGDLDDDAHIGVVRAGSAAATLANLVAAINATDADGAHATLTQTDSETPALANGTESVLASIAGGTNLVLKPATEPGGDALPSSPDVALSDNLTAAVAWSITNLNTGGGRAEGERRQSTTSFAVTAAMITAGVHFIEFPFTPASYAWSAKTSAGLPRLTGADTLASAGGGAFQLTLNNDTADLDAGDVVTVTAWA